MGEQIPWGCSLCRAGLRYWIYGDPVDNWPNHIIHTNVPLHRFVPRATDDFFKHECKVCYDMCSHPVHRLYELTLEATQGGAHAGKDAAIQAATHPAHGVVPEARDRRPRGRIR